MKWILYSMNYTPFGTFTQYYQVKLPIATGRYAVDPRKRRSHRQQDTHAEWHIHHGLDQIQIIPLAREDRHPVAER